MPATPDTDMEFLRKLGLKDGQRLGLVAAPDGWAQRLAARAQVESWSSAGQAGEADIILAWLQPSDDPRAVFDRLERRIPPDGAVWAVIPKKTALRSGEPAVAWGDMQAAGLASGRLVDNKELRFDDRYYGTRFVVRLDARPSRRGRR